MADLYIDGSGDDSRRVTMEQFNDEMSIWNEEQIISINITVKLLSKLTIKLSNTLASFTL